MSGAAQSDATFQNDPRIVVLIAYGLYFAALVTGGLSTIVGVAVAYIKRPEVKGTLWESHLTNLIRVFWAGLIIFALWLTAIVAGLLGVWSGAEHDNLPLAVGFLPAAYLTCVLFLVWYLYRTIKGFLRAADRKSYG
jgi:uncharacterized membrane protein